MVWMRHGFQPARRVGPVLFLGFRSSSKAALRDGDTPGLWNDLPRCSCFAATDEGGAWWVFALLPYLLGLRRVLFHLKPDLGHP